MNKHNLCEENYFSVESNIKYSGSSQIKDFIGCPAIKGCPARAMATMLGEYSEERSKALLIGSYVDEALTGDISLFRARTPEIFKLDGELRADFVLAEKMVSAVETQPMAMKFLSGGNQEILVGEINGLEIKIKIDNLVKESGIPKGIVDLKTTQDMYKIHYVPDVGKVNWIDYWNYYAQLAQYRAILRQNYEGVPEDIPVFLVAVDKKKEPSVRVIKLAEHKLQMEMEQLRSNCRAVLEYKTGLRELERCGVCDYCRQTEVITEIIWGEDLGFLN